MTFVAEEPLAEPMVSKLFIGGHRELMQYVLEVMEGILDFKINDGDCWSYTYHDRMTNMPVIKQIRGKDSKLAVVNQKKFVVDELKRQADSRRAVISIRDNGVDPFIDDPACLQHIQYFIRGDKLHCKVLMRSNDAPKATFMNAFAFIMLQKEIADSVGVPVGTYTHRANSFHCYSRDFELLDQYVSGITENTIVSDNIGAITYNYTDFYKELMEESMPAIYAQVDKLRREYDTRTGGSAN
jgi:thymidylate synthase